MFKNAQIYRLTKLLSLPLDGQELDGLLSEYKFKSCAPQDAATFGWVSPLGKRGQTMLHVADGQWLICCQREERLLPNSVVDDVVEEQIEEKEQTLGRQVTRKEKMAIKEDVIISLLPKAFTRRQKTQVWIDNKAGFIVVNSSSAKKAEDALSLLRKTIGSLPVAPWTSELESDISSVLTAWLKSKTLPDGFDWGNEVNLESLDGGVIKAKGEDLLGDELQQHLEAGKIAVSLALELKESLSFVLTEDGAIKRIKFSDLVEEKRSDVTNDDELAQFDADFTIMTGELSQFIAKLIIALSKK